MVAPSIYTQPELGRLLDVSYTDTKTLRGKFDLMSSHWSRGAEVWCLSTQAGTLGVYYVELTGKSAELIQTLDVKANVLLVKAWDYLINRLHVEFTPSAAPGTVWVDGYTYPRGP